MSEPAAELPRLVQLLLRRILPREQLERALGDLDELYRRVAAGRGKDAARHACVREAASILLWSAVDRARRVRERPSGAPTPRGSTSVSAVSRDLRYAARALLRSPGFTVVALLTLALGIGANTAIFSVVHPVLLHPVPWPEADRVAVIGWEWSAGGEPTWGLSQVKADFWKEGARSFGAFAITDETPFVLTGAGDPVQVAGELVSDGYFDVVGIEPALGRRFAAEEHEPDGPPVVILTDGLWRRALGADPGVVGRQLVLDRALHTVVGVMPPGFRGAEPEGADLLAPLRLVVNPRSQGHNYFSFGRLASGVTEERLESEVAAFRDGFDRAYPGILDDGGAFRSTRYGDYLVGDFLRTAVWLLFGAVGTVLLIACANVTSLLLGRAYSRGPELAVRAALGAGRGRVLGQLLAESLLLTLTGGALGVLLARAGLDAILALAPPGVPGLDRIGLNVPVLGFALLVSVGTGTAVGLAGALPVLRSDLSALRAGARARAGSAGSPRLRGLLVMTECAFSVVLLVGAGLLVTSFFRLRAVDLGFEPEGVYTVEVRLPPERYTTTEATWSFERRVLERLSALPGVTMAGSTANLPLVRGGNIGVTVLSPGERQHDVVELRAVSPAFLDLLGARMLAGRGFEETDGPGATPVALVNETFVGRFFAAEEPLGATLSIDGPERTVVGVLGDLRDVDPGQEARPTVFVPRSQAGDGATRLMNESFVAAFAVRSDAPAGLASALPRAVQEVDPELPIVATRPLGEVVAESMARQRFNASLFATFGALALALTGIGVYGIVSYSVGQRRHEIGLRAALGASRRGVLALVVRQGMAMVVTGVALGVLAAFAGSRLLSGILFGVATADPATFTAVVVVIVLVALLASYVPARRASRVDPMIALRAD